jgi:hypothetical protein
MERKNKIAKERSNLKTQVPDIRPHKNEVKGENPEDQWKDAENP